MKYGIGDIVIVNEDVFQDRKYKDKIGIILEVDKEFQGYRIMICGVPVNKIWFHEISIRERIYKSE
jgi:hypothetical protein